MLPFLKHSKEGAGSGPADSLKRNGEVDYDMLESAAFDLISAVQRKDVKATSEALRAAFQICDMEPHQEGPHK